MATIIFDPAIFRSLFPAFSCTSAYPNTMLDMFWDSATNFISNKQYFFSGGLRPAQQRYALNLMTAHLVYLNAQISKGENTGLMQGATIDKISVTLTPPPDLDKFSYWLNQSPYGQQLLAMLDLASTGGFYFGGYPVVGSVRR